MMNGSNNFLLSDIKPAVAIDGWQDFMDDGVGFLKTATGGFAKRKDVFSPVILYNLIAMAIEKFVMAALMWHGSLPYNHTMRDLVEALEETFPGEISEIKKGLLELDAFQDICDLEGFSITPPELEKIPAMLDLVEKLKLFTLQTVKSD